MIYLALPVGWAFDDEFECRTLQSVDRQLRDQVSQVAVQRYWARAQRSLDAARAKGPGQAVATAQRLIADADPSEINVLAEELSSWLADNNLPGGWLPDALAQKVPGLSACASASHRRVEPSTSVNKNVTTPEGAAAAGADTPAECHIRQPATLHIAGTRPRDTQVLPARGQHVGRPKALDKSKAALARRMHESGEPASTIANALGVSRATVYRVLERPGLLEASHGISWDLPASVTGSTGSRQRRTVPSDPQRQAGQFPR
jgi:hypothetical protein